MKIAGSFPYLWAAVALLWHHIRAGIWAADGDAKACHQGHGQVDEGLRRDFAVQNDRGWPGRT
jgi:hypothetical protein